MKQSNIDNLMIPRQESTESSANFAFDFLLLIGINPDTKHDINFTVSEFTQNLKDLRINKYDELVNKEVYYSKKSYGIHTVIKWDKQKAQYLLDFEGSKFWSNPFRIKRI